MSDEPKWVDVPRRRFDETDLPPMCSVCHSLLDPSPIEGHLSHLTERDCIGALTRRIELLELAVWPTGLRCTKGTPP